MILKNEGFVLCFGTACSVNGSVICIRTLVNVRIVKKVEVRLCACGCCLGKGWERYACGFKSSEKWSRGVLLKGTSVKELPVDLSGVTAVNATFVGLHPGTTGIDVFVGIFQRPFVKAMFAGEIYVGYTSRNRYNRCACGTQGPVIGVNC